MFIIKIVRSCMRRMLRVVASWLNAISGGRLSPDVVTMTGLLMHIPIAYLIVIGQLYWAAGLLFIFGLFDTLDGELARLQHRSSARGMLLDALTDRLKEVILYSGAAVKLSSNDQMAAAWCVLACGASLSVSYVKAKGEAAIANQNKTIDHHTLNYLFQDGIMSFEVRMFVFFVGLLADKLLWAVIIIAVASALTMIKRFINISRALMAANVSD